MLGVYDSCRLGVTVLSYVDTEHPHMIGWWRYLLSNYIAGARTPCLAAALSPFSPAHTDHPTSR
jgi:hypothetical protein